MKLKNMILIFSIFFILICLGCVSASDNASVLSSDANAALENSNIDSVVEKTASGDVLKANETSTTNSTSPQKNTTTKKETIAAFCDDAFIKKSNKYYTVRAYSYDDDTDKIKYYKDVKLTVKVKIGKTVKTYNVKTDSNGIAKVFNIKKLKAGTYKVSVTSNDTRYKVKEKASITIFNKKQKTVTLYSVNKEKRVKKIAFQTLYFPKDGQYNKGTYVETYPANDYFGPAHSFITKVKITFKNKKTGKKIIKTVKHKRDSDYGWDAVKTELIKGYVPVKTKIWYVTL